MAANEYVPGATLDDFAAGMKTELRRQRWDAAASVDDRRDEILKGLGAALRERGFSALTMQDIADRLGLAKGNLYYYFKNKQDLIYHGHLKCMKISLQALDKAEASSGSVSGRLRTLLTSHIRGMTEEVYSAVLLADLESLAPAQRRRYVALRDRFEQGVLKLIEEGVARHEFRKQDTWVAGFSTLGAINWIPKWYRTGGELSPAQVAESFADFFLRALK
jgi:AcrR family transcriptional regulator